MQHRRCSYGVGVIAVLLVLAFAGTACAGDRDHENGFFMRLSAGGGGAKTKISNGEESFELSGPAGDINFAFGAIVARNLALHATLFGWGIQNPTVKIDGEDVGEASADLTMGAIGIGITYYIMPANVYLSGTVGAGALSFDAGVVTLETDPGLAVEGTIGNEWWVGRSWALGIAVGVSGHSIPEQEVDEKWSGPSVAVRFSATMN